MGVGVATGMALERKNIQGVAKNGLYGGISGMLAGILARNMIPKTSVTGAIPITNPLAYGILYTIAGFDNHLVLGI